MKKILRVMAAAALMGAVFFAPVAMLRAQEATPEAEEQVEETGPGLWDILYGGSIVTLGIWMAIGTTSFVMVWLVADGAVTVKREKIMPDTLVEGFATL